MKFSLEIGGGDKATRQAPAVTGALLRPPMPAVTPGMAEITRQFQAVNTHMLRAYDSAITSNFNADFKGVYNSADAEILASLYTSSARARALAVNTPHGRAIVRTFKTNVVGHKPFRLTMRLGKWTKKTGKNGSSANVFVEDEETNRAIEREWEIFGRPENFTSRKKYSRMVNFMTMEGAAVTRGSVLMRLHRAYPHNRYGFAVEVLEADRLQESYNGRAPETGNPIRFSIEYDKDWNYPVNYWILTRHPGDIFGGNGQGQPATSGPRWREQVPAEDIIHYNNLPDRPEQSIGFTELDATIQSLHRNFQYDKALTFAAISSCCKPFWIKKNFPTGMQFNATSDEMAALFEKLAAGRSPTGGASGNSTSPEVGQQQGITQRISTEVPASTLDLEYGQELMQVDPKFPIEAAHNFRQDNLKDIATGSGIGYSSLTGDFQSLGYIAAQMSKQPERDYFMVRQVHFIDEVVRPLFREWLRYAILSGPLAQLDVKRLNEYVDAAIFKGKRWPFTDALREVQALVLKVQNRLMSPQQAQDELPDGMDYEDVLAMIATAQAQEEAHGLNPLTMNGDQPSDGTTKPEGDEKPESDRARHNGRHRGSDLTGLLLAERVD